MRKTKIISLILALICLVCVFAACEEVHVIFTTDSDGNIWYRYSNEAATEDRLLISAPVDDEEAPTLEFETRSNGAVYYKYSNETEWTLLFENETTPIEFKTEDDAVWWKYTTSSTWTKLYELDDTSITIDADSNLVAQYNAAVDSGYNGTFLAYVEAVSEAVSSIDNASSVQHALRSTVSVWCADSATSSEYVTGSGVVYQLDKEAGDAYILTNCHVVYKSPTVTVGWGGRTTTEGEYYSYVQVMLFGAEVSGELIEAEVIGGLEAFDIAVIKVTGSDIIKNNACIAADVSDDIFSYAGQTVYAIGNPDGSGISATAGIISVDSEYLELSSIKETSGYNEYRVIRVDAAINPGNSGGGLFDINGELVGIVNAKNTENDNMGYALPIYVCTAIADKIISTYSETNTVVATLNRVALGVGVHVDSSSSVYNTTTGYCEIVQNLSIVDTIDNVLVLTSSSAAYGILYDGDELVSVKIDGVTYELTRMFVLSELLWKCDVGDSIELTIIRNNVQSVVTVSFGATNVVSFV